MEQRAWTPPEINPDGGEPETDPASSGMREAWESVVLVGVDFSACSKAAVVRAVEWSTALRARMEVMHVWECLEAATTGFTEEAVRWLGAVGVDPQQMTTRRGIPWIELTRRARSLEAALVVLGTQGQSGRQPLALGTTASRLAMAAPCPVLLVKASEITSSRIRGDGTPARAETKYLQSNL